MADTNPPPHHPNTGQTGAEENASGNEGTAGDGGEEAKQPEDTTGGDVAAPPAPEGVDVLDVVAKANATETTADKEGDEGTGGDEGNKKRKAGYVDIDGAKTDGEDEDGKVVDEEEGGDKGPGKEAKGITRIRYSNDFKVKVLDELEVSHVTVAEMARRHKLPEATLRDWVKTRDKIRTAQVNRRGSAKSNSRDNLQKVTDALRTFMDLNDRLGACGMSKLPITNAMIAKQGQEVKALLLEKDKKKPFLTPQERKTLNAFNASIWWSKKWARKHNLHSVGHREAAKAAAALSSQVPEIRKQYAKDHVFFVVDTMLFFKLLPTRSFVLEDSGTAGMNNVRAPRKYLDILKDRVSMFICSNSSGTHKIPLTMVSDAKHPPSFVANRQKVFPYLHQENAWANPKMLLTWWKDIFLPNIREWTDEKVLLILQKPSIVDLDDPQEQVSVKFLPPLLANNHNNTADGLSISSFFEPPLKMLSVVKTKYRYALLKEVFQIFEERDNRRNVAATAMLDNPGLKQGHLPHLQDCMRILNDVWTELSSSAISSQDDEGDGRKKRRRKRRKKKGTSDEDIIENDAMVFSDELGTDEVIKDIIHFFRKNDNDVQSLPTEDASLNPLDKSVAEVKQCFLNEKLLLKSNQDELRKILENWVGLEESQDIRTMLQTEILAGMKFRLIVGVDDVDEDEMQQTQDASQAKESMDAEAVAANEAVTMDCATQLLQCAVRLSKENSVFHDLASKLIEGADAAFVALRLSKLPPELRYPKPPQPPKKRKPRTASTPRKKRAKVSTGEEKSDKIEAAEAEDKAIGDDNKAADVEMDEEAERGDPVVVENPTVYDSAAMFAI